MLSPVWCTSTTTEAIPPKNFSEVVQGRAMYLFASSGVTAGRALLLTPNTSALHIFVCRPVHYDL